MSPQLAATIITLLLLSPNATADAPRSKARVGLPFPPGVEAAESTESSLETICGETDDSQHVEQYDGSLGVKKSFVKTHEPSTGQIRWLGDLAARFPSPNSPGNVSGQRWCSGALISKDLFLTAAHCFEVQKKGWITPSRGTAKIPLPPRELAPLMVVVFNYQLNGQSGAERKGVTYEIRELVEYGFDRDPVDGEHLDYAIVRLKPLGAKHAGESFRIASMDSSKEARDKAKILTIIQHPTGSPKKIDAGKDIVPPRDLLLRYGDLDSQGGASGSPVLDQDGKLIGVHTNGGCTKWGGFNYGVSLHAISQTSDQVK